MQKQTKTIEQLKQNMEDAQRLFERAERRALKSRKETDWKTVHELRITFMEARATYRGRKREDILG
jgi:hypothetical protein